MTLTLTPSTSILLKEEATASAVPVTSDLTMTGISLTSPASICDFRSSRVIATEAFLSFSSFALALACATALASLSSSKTLKLSPATGTSFKPMISTGVPGKASVISLPISLVILRTLPYAVPTTTESDCLKVPFCTSKVETGPLPLSSLASMTVPVASFFGLAFKSRTSATTRIVSKIS